MANQTELRAAAARLLYCDNRDTADYDMLIAFIDETFRDKEEREKPPLTLGDQVRRMDDNSLAWQFASLLVGGAGGVMEGIGMTPNLDLMMSQAYPKMLEEVKKPVPQKEA